ncbi:Flp pilus assembly complex ATPase component TadA [Antribacter sp. KLBMP9083]|uniref:Flp pilus assembly complex ATPase component TadA n=1 Tax=Antribacter soli TaxID=2910976 RepID=A0AA41QKH1_9MICO|nr:ATPase, T2SS/T4P/T4SS family [Antribacter soli]MCF4123714.1 Flp pilus assembly complex ATPase component TadA [Antribacter soli]
MTTLCEGPTIPPEGPDEPPRAAEAPVVATVAPAGQVVDGQAPASPSSVPFFADPVPGPPGATHRAANPWAAAGSSGATSNRTVPNGAAGGQGSNGMAFAEPSGPGWSSYRPQGERPSGPVRHHDSLVDWKLVGVLRRQVSERLSQKVAVDPDLDPVAQREVARGLVLEAIEETVAERANTGQAPLSGPQRDAVARAVFAALFGFGRLQQLMDDDRVENIEVEKDGRVWVQLRNGRRVLGPRVADSDQELIEAMQFLASRSAGAARNFSQAQPVLHLRLDDGSRLSASAWVTPFPDVAIRRHRLVQVSLEDLARGGLLPPEAASLLRAAVRARMSIIVSGAPGSGKTTLVRALIGCIPATERLITLETDYELHVHEYRPLTWAYEERRGSGEVGPDGRQAGVYSLSRLTEDIVRKNPDRVVLGECRGPEIVPLVKNTENGSGVMSTTHARDAAAAIEKLVTCGMEAGGQWTDVLMTRKLAQWIDLVVHVEREPADFDEELNFDPDAYWNLTDADLDDDPGRPRRVTEIVAISRGDQPGTFATTHIFRTDEAGNLVPGVLPDAFRKLTRFGFDLDTYTTRQASSPDGLREVG